MRYFISSDWCTNKKGKLKHYSILGDEKGVVLKAKKHEKLILKIRSWLQEKNLDSIIVKYDCNGNYVRIHANEQDAYIESVDSVIAGW